MSSVSPETASTLRQDFFLSYYLSRGGFPLQSTLLEAAAVEYTETLPDDERASLQAMKTDEFKDLVSFSTLPGYHSPERIRSMHTEIRRSAHKMHRALGETNQIDNDRLPAKIAHGLIQRDLHFAGYFVSRSSRRQARSSDDKYVSFFREHLLFGAPTHSKTFDAILGGVRFGLQDIVASGSSLFQTDLDLLEKSWQKHHNGQAFDPEGLTNTRTKLTNPRLEHRF